MVGYKALNTNAANTASFEYDETVINVLGDRHAYVPTQVYAPSY